MQSSIGKEELKDRINQEKVLIVDVRSKSEYKAQHIAGAINIPTDDFEQNLKMFNRYKLLVTTCGKGGGRSEDAVELLNSMGIKSKWLCGGTFGWQEL